MIRKSSFKYNEITNVYMCPENKELKYTSTDKNGNMNYRAKKKDCINCSLKEKCSKSYQKVILRHIWSKYGEFTEDVRKEAEIKEIYRLRKSTIERVFAMAKEQHSMRYMRARGKQKVNNAIALVFSCLNIKKMIKLTA